MGLRLFAANPDAPPGERNVSLGLACDGGTLLCLAQGEVVFPARSGGYPAQRTEASRAGWLIRTAEAMGGYHVIGPCCRDHGGRIIHSKNRLAEHADPGACSPAEGNPEGEVMGNQSGDRGGAADKGAADKGGANKASERQPGETAEQHAERQKREAEQGGGGSAGSKSGE